MRLRFCLSVVLPIALCSSNGWAQSRPARPIRVVVPFTAGSATDINAVIVRASGLKAN